MLHINTKTSEIYLIYIIDLNKWVLEHSGWAFNSDNIIVCPSIISDETINALEPRFDKVLYAPLKIGDRKLVFSYGKFD